MPWCSSCDRFLAPPTVRADGTCPRCGSRVDAGHGRAATATGDERDEPIALPWHLKLLAGAVALYLGFRAWQGIDWVIHRF